MEEVDKSVVGVFIDAEHKEYKMNLQFTEKGLYGYLGSTPCPLYLVQES
ncbi:MAG: hypothetical protein R2778_07345 [Saprospiraceae bacterium]